MRIQGGWVTECFLVIRVTLVCSVAHSSYDFLMQQVLLDECLYMSEFMLVGSLQSPSLFSGEGNGRL